MSFIERGGWWVIGQILLFGLYALAMLGTEGITEGIGLDFARLVGIGMVVVAVIIGTWSFVVLGRNLTIYPFPVHEATLTDRGPYRLVRHPIYLAVIVGAVGLALAWLNTA
ncbi:MAG: isoprenylcysteine carboxylmethyltransferase family protein, partial [Actinomycetia bacterium]|nr:isoprenylcysteine carboxylmethyltransferase family protein [Actinomycetes bacterium]